MLHPFQLEQLRCFLTESVERDGQVRPRRFRIIDKHNRQRYVYNLQIDIDLAGDDVALGLGEESLPARPSSIGRDQAPSSAAPPTTEELIDDLAGMLKYEGDDLRPILERASARETAARVACGAVAKRLLREFGIRVESHILSIGDVAARLPAKPPVIPSARCSTRIWT